MKTDEAQWWGIGDPGPSMFCSFFLALTRVQSELPGTVLPVGSVGGAGEECLERP